GFAGTAVTHETVITVTADEVEQRRGQGWAPGIMAGLPIPVIERRACTGETRLLVTGVTGEPLFLSQSHRLFSPAQKVALTVTAGGTCQYPGCHVPAPYLEAHHVRWYARDAGPTDIGNGIMLCSYHHHLVHAKHAPVEIRSHDGEHWILPKGWVGPPDPTHRRQTRGHLARARPRRVPNPWTQRSTTDSG
ncbi:HNH endonuclease, partial [uncultured Amnibacterium sp.]|uniref:HNH endonuclease n=1 Tax=uncultured Amnibacterium sp. TaxID=1631851 RepID=UPI0035CAE362